MNIIDDIRLHEIYKNVPECWYELSLVNKSTRRDIADVYQTYGKKGYNQEPLGDRGRWYELIRSMACPDTIMGYASIHGRMDIVQLMIAKGAENWNRGLACASGGGHLDIVQLMIAKGANDWNRAMESASKNGHTSIVQLMISMGSKEQ